MFRRYQTSKSDSTLLGRLTSSEKRSLAELWCLLIEFFNTNANDVFSLRNVHDKYQNVNFDETAISRIADSIESVNPESCPFMSSRPDVITPAHIRQMFWSYIVYDHHPFEVLVRFLKLKKFNAFESFKLVLRACVWKLDQDVYGVIRNGESTISSEQFESSKAFIYKHDKFGRPVVYINVVKHDREADTQEQYRRHVIYMVETIALFLQKNAESIVAVINLEGFSDKQLDVSLGGFLFDLQFVYPKGVEYALIINAPFFISAGYKLVRPILDMVMTLPIEFTSKAGLSKYIDPSNVPISFGGTDPFEWKYEHPTLKDGKRFLDQEVIEILFKQRMEEVRNVEEYFLHWCKQVVSGVDEEIDEDRDTDYLQHLGESFCAIDEFLRFPSFYHRKEVLSGKKINWANL